MTVPSLPEPAPAREARVLDLALARGPDGLTRIVRRRVAWPWSLARGFRLGDPAGGPGGCLTLVPQAAGAALIAGDRWEQALSLGPGAAARLRTAGATLVQGEGAARSLWRLSVGPGAWLGFLPDPAVLCTGALLVQEIRAEVAPDAALVLADGFCLRSPGERPEGWQSLLSLARPGEAPFLAERQAAGCAAFDRLARLPGAPRAFGSLTFVGLRPLPEGPVEVPGLPGLYAAAGGLRGGAGVSVRLAAPDGGTLAQALAALLARLVPGFPDRP